MSTLIKVYRPITVLTESYTSRELARGREKYFKSGVGKEYLKRVVEEKGL